MILIDPAICLAAAIYFEARGEIHIGQLKVAEVILNRVKSRRFPNAVCKVVKQNKQFSFLNGKPVLTINHNNGAWEMAVFFAGIVLKGGGKSTNACHYAHTDVDNMWTKKLKGMQDGNHIFYTGGC